ncbi:hypothetical protein PSAC2689_200058 [Paraburkholderia sacchari]
MIVQQCYDEGIANVDKKIIKLIATMEAENAIACVNFARNYLNEASKLERDVEKQSSSLIAWVGSELALNLARQRLDNIILIKKSCKF